MTPRTYNSPAAFKQSLEERLRSQSTSGFDFVRRRQLLVFDRFLARVVRIVGKAAILKGGLALELRLARARTTKDVDLRFSGPAANLLERLQEAGRIDLGDFMTFEVRPDPEHPEIQNAGMTYDGLRHRVEPKLGGKRYGQPFGVDVVFADPILGEPETMIAPDVLTFAGIAPPTLHVYPVESHIAEKLHAYTLPRERENSRVKDLPDLALLGTIRALEGARLRLAMERTFSFRGTHDLPPNLPDPPSSWIEVYQRMAAEDNLEWRTLPELVAVARAFLDPLLDGSATGRWSPSQWRWE